MVGGSLVVAACLLVLGWTSEIVGAFVADEERVWLQIPATIVVLSSFLFCLLFDLGNQYIGWEVYSNGTVATTEKDLHSCGCGSEHLRSRLRDQCW